MPDLTDFQLEVTRLFFTCPRAGDFCWPWERPCSRSISRHGTRKTSISSPPRIVATCPRPATRWKPRPGSGAGSPERIHDSDTFCRLVIRSDAAEVVTDLAVGTPPESEEIRHMRVMTASQASA
jgi:hypothetical protein